MQGANESVLARYRALLNTTAELGGVINSEFAALMQEADVNFGRKGELPRLSTLNNDGSPIQVCVTIGAQGRRVRLLMDPASDETCPVRRLERARTALRRVLALGPDPTLPDVIEHYLGACLPGAHEVRAYLPSGALWVAWDVRLQGFAAYVSARWGSIASRWLRVRAWLAQVAGPGAAEALEPLQWQTDVASVGLEGDSSDNLSAKVYFRLRGPTPLFELSLAPFVDTRVQRFLAVAIGDHAVRRSGLVFSVSVDISSGRLTGGKIDVCAHCTPRGRQEWVALVERLAAEFDLVDAGVREPLLEGKAEVAFLGFGIDSYGFCRLNVYLKAPSERRFDPPHVGLNAGPDACPQC